MYQGTELDQLKRRYESACQAHDNSATKWSRNYWLVIMRYFRRKILVH